MNDMSDEEVEGIFEQLRAALDGFALPTATGRYRTGVDAEEFALMNASQEAFEFKHKATGRYLLLARASFMGANPRGPFVILPGQLVTVGTYDYPREVAP